MAPRALVGPVIADLENIGGGTVSLATAFYSAGALEVIDFAVDYLRLFVRLDTSSLREWAAGSINPVALSDFVERHSKQCKSIALLVSPSAHAKIYIGSNGCLVGSANLSVRGFSGDGNEILWFEDDPKRHRQVSDALDDYERGFSRMTADELKDFVRENLGKARSLAKKLPSQARFDEDKLPTKISRPARLGDYTDFLQWLGRQRGAAATTISARATGEGHLTGHIRQNFFGLRQYFLRRPSEMKRLASYDPETYGLPGDVPTRIALRSFVQQHATNEDSFNVSTWRTYLPESLGGKPKTGGGSSGNVKRMLPLVARYVQSRV